MNRSVNRPFIEAFQIVLGLLLMIVILLTAVDTAIAMSGSLRPWDEALTTAAYQVDYPWLDVLMVALTYAGMDPPLFLFAIAVALWAARRGYRGDGLLLVVAALAARVIGVAAKFVVEAPRPALHAPPWPLEPLHGYGYPSGHALMSMTILGFGAVVLTCVSARPRVRWVVWLVCGALILGIGSSRVYLGLHWANDVLGGYLYGACIVLAASMVHVRRRIAARQAMADASPGASSVDCRSGVIPQSSPDGGSAQAASTARWNELVDRWVRVKTRRLDDATLTRRKLLHTAQVVWAWPLLTLDRPLLVAILVVVCVFVVTTQRRVPYASLGLVTLLAFASPVVVAGAWVVFAMGDGLAALVGRASHGGRLPWNEQKSWTGFVAFVVTASVSLFIFLGAFSGIAVPRALVGALAAGTLGAVVESLPAWLDDNYTVIVAAGLVLHILLAMP